MTAASAATNRLAGAQPAHLSSLCGPCDDSSGDSPQRGQLGRDLLQIAQRCARGEVRSAEASVAEGGRSGSPSRPGAGTRVPRRGPSRVRAGPGVSGKRRLDALGAGRCPWCGTAPSPYGMFGCVCSVVHEVPVTPPGCTSQELLRTAPPTRRGRVSNSVDVQEALQDGFGHPERDGVAASGQSPCHSVTDSDLCRAYRCTGQAPSIPRVPRSYPEVERLPTPSDARQSSERFLRYFTQSRIHTGSVVARYESAGCGCERAKKRRSVARSGDPPKASRCPIGRPPLGDQAHERVTVAAVDGAPPPPPPPARRGCCLPSTRWGWRSRCSYWRCSGTGSTWAASAGCRGAGPSGREPLTSAQHRPRRRPVLLLSRSAGGPGLQGTSALPSVPCAPRPEFGLGSGGATGCSPLLPWPGWPRRPPCLRAAPPVRPTASRTLITTTGRGTGRARVTPPSGSALEVDLLDAGLHGPAAFPGVGAGAHVRHGDVRPVLPFAGESRPSLSSRARIISSDAWPSSVKPIIS